MGYFSFFNRKIRENQQGQRYADLQANQEEEPNYSDVESEQETEGEQSGDGEEESYSNYGDPDAESEEEEEEEGEVQSTEGEEGEVQSTEGEEEPTYSEYDVESEEGSEAEEPNEDKEWDQEEEPNKSEDGYWEKEWDQQKEPNKYSGKEESYQEEEPNKSEDGYSEKEEWNQQEEPNKSEDGYSGKEEWDQEEETNEDAADPGELKEEWIHSVLAWRHDSNPMVPLSYDQIKVVDSEEDDDAKDDWSNLPDFMQYKLPNNEELQDEDRSFSQTQLKEIRAKRMEQIAALLNNSELHTLENHDRRIGFINQFIADFSFLYGTPSRSVQILVEVLGAEETMLVVSVSPTNLCICINPLKTRVNQVITLLKKYKINCMPVSWFHHSLVTDATKEQYDDLCRPELFDEGYYTILESSNMLLPIMTLEPKKRERICNLRAFCGDGTFYMASLLHNSGQIIASVEDGSIEKFGEMVPLMGVRNISLYRGGLEHQLQEREKNFDKVLLCAPSTEQCLGSSVFTRGMTNAEVEEIIQNTVKVQKEMLLEAVDLVKPKGYVVYCTRSVFIEENENVVDYVLNSRNVKLVDVPTNIIHGKAGFSSYGEQEFDKNMYKARRYYPHINNMKSLFLAKLQKIG